MTGQALRVVLPADDRAGGDALLTLWSEWMGAAGAADRTITTRVGGVLALSSRGAVAWVSGLRSELVHDLAHVRDDVLPALPCNLGDMGNQKVDDHHASEDKRRRVDAHP